MDQDTNDLYRFLPEKYRDGPDWQEYNQDQYVPDRDDNDGFWPDGGNRLFV